MTEFGPLLRVSQGGHQGVGWAGVLAQAPVVIGGSNFPAAECSWQLPSSKSAGECLSPLDPLPTARLSRTGPCWIISLLSNSEQTY